MSNVDNVITTTTNTVVDSANSAVSIGRWSNLAIIAFSFHTFTRRSVGYVTIAPYSCERGGCIGQLQYLLLA